MRTIAIIIVVALVMFTIINTLKTRTYKNLVSYLQQGKIKEFNQKIDSRSVKLLFPKSSLLDLKFNAAIVEQDKKAAIKYLEELCEMLFIGKNVAYELLQRKKIKAFRIGRLWKIPKRSVEEYILSESKIDRK